MPDQLSYHEKTRNRHHLKTSISATGHQELGYALPEAVGWLWFVLCAAIGWMELGTIASATELVIFKDTDLAESVGDRIVFQDFEGTNALDEWVVEGDFIGLELTARPAGSQRYVTGNRGKFFNSFSPTARDKATGRLTSPDFKPPRRYIHFLLGGGNNSREVGVSLLLNGSPVRTVSGRIHQGMSWPDEHMRWFSWDVSEYSRSHFGEDLQIQIYDEATGPWGHILVDEIIFSDHPIREIDAGPFVPVYDPSTDRGEPWYINDHALLKGPDGLWHLIGITHAEAQNPRGEVEFAHATAPTLFGPWTTHPAPLSGDRANQKEFHIWAPHIVEHDGLYYMFYTGGNPVDRDDLENYYCNLAISKDLFHWEKHPGNPLFKDGFSARDHMVLRMGEQWIMYYTANEQPNGGNFAVVSRTSQNLLDWDHRRVVFRDVLTGRHGGQHESPFVLPVGDDFYLFLGPRAGYSGTDVFRSHNPFQWDFDDWVGWIPAHAPEIINSGTPEHPEYYITSCGWQQRGLYVAPLHIYPEVVRSNEEIIRSFGESNLTRDRSVSGRNPVAWTSLP